MRPYLAVIKDSFREAFAARVLWLTLGLIGLFLFAIAPLSLDPGLATELESEEVIDGYGLAAELVAASRSDEPSPSRHLWSILSSSIREKVQEGAKAAESSSGRRGRLRREWNALLEKPEFYDAESWQDVELDDELHSLAVRDDLSEAELRARNRRLLAAAFPDHIRLDRTEVMYLSYFGWRLDAPIPISPEGKTKLVNEVVVATCAILLGFFGVFISILVTASLVPRTFEAGEISLLLSKPVSRPLLFLTRFLGGCAFTLVNAAFLMAGLWLVVGLRFDVWNPRLLLCIPIYLFLFMIYYAVSATTGAIWRNAILSICLTLVFWFTLFLLATARDTVEELVIAPNRLSQLIPIDDGLLVVNESLEVMQWSEVTPMGGPGWSEVFRDSGGGPPRFARRFAFADSGFRPVYDAEQDRMLALEALPGRGFGARSSSRVLVGHREQDWERESAGQAPTPMSSIFVDESGRVILVGLDHIYEFTGNAVEQSETQKWLAEKLSGFMKFGNDDAFRELRPDLDEWKPPFAVDMDTSTGALAVYSDGELSVLSIGEEGRYDLSATTDLEPEDKTGGIVVIRGDHFFLTRESGEVSLFDAATLKEIQRYTPFEESEVEQMTVSSDGRYVVALSDEKQAWLYDLQNSNDLSEAVPGQGDIEAIAFNSQKELITADRTSRVRVVNPAKMNIVAEYDPGLDITELAYRYCLNPMYIVLPKPGELNAIVNELLTQPDEASDDSSEDEFADQRRTHSELWSAFWSNLAFLVVILGYACWHVSRRDF
ncbi:MAG: ABC transporter permease [Planctomycetaceae bacterium]|nr:ABC transporter permease [Planctomycetaceae bacterium]